MEASKNTAVEPKNLSKHSLSQYIYDRLLDKFQQNELVPGNILNRREIAQEFGVSVAPVLEALLQLEMEGFVESIPRKGTIVKPIREEDVFGQLMLREAVECQAALLYCGEKVRARRNELSILAEKLEQSEPDAPNHWQEDIIFHRTLVALSECPALVREYDRLIHLSNFYQMNRILVPMDYMERRNHLELIAQLEIDDPDHAMKAIREHLRSGKQHLFKDRI
jgi:DNA-binding GntR family transcriptional regulator